MPKNVYNSVVDHRLLDGQTTVEDVMTVTLPEIKNTITEMDVAGMVAAIDVPDIGRFEKMSFEVNHNKGLNSDVLSRPGMHEIELRIARQKLTTSTGTLDYEGVKVRVRGILLGVKKNDMERGNPLAETVTYGVYRYEEEINGKQHILIDVLGSKVVVDGKDYTSSWKHLLE